jgi:lysophospholipid acyltransferase (LPLAT)-like uncharacterized protein
VGCVKLEREWWFTTKAWVVRVLVSALCRTYRLVAVAGSERLDAVREGSEAVIVCFWHNRILYCTYHLGRELVWRGFPVKVMISRSRDGELISRAIEAWGGGTARGSSSRGGSGALRQLVRSLAEGRVAAVTTPDGPRGPVYRAQSGTVVLAQLSGAPVYPISYCPEKMWRLRSWDGFMLPKPFSRVSVAVGEPLWVPRDLDDNAREAARERLESALLETDRTAAALFSEEK